MLSPTCCKAGIASEPQFQQDDRLAASSQIKSGHQSSTYQPRASYHWEPRVWLVVGKPDHDHRAVPVHYGFSVKWLSDAPMSSVLQIHRALSFDESLNETIRNGLGSCDVSSQCLVQQGTLQSSLIKAQSGGAQSRWCFRLVVRARRCVDFGE